MKLLGYEIKMSKCSEKTGDPQQSLYIDLRDVQNLLGTKDGFIDTSTPDGQARAFASCSILASIITKKVSAISDARYWAKDDKGEDIEKPREFERINHPNPYQTLSEFVCMIEFFSQIFGKAYIVKVPLVGIKGDFELYVIPNLMVTENEVPSSIPSFAPNSDIRDYTINLGGGINLTIPKEEMFVVNDVTYALNKIGSATSRLVALKYPVNTFLASYQAVNELLVDRGMLGILSLMSDDPMVDNIVPATKEDKEALREQLDKYGIMRNKCKIDITSYKASFVPVSSTISDLGLTDIQRNCKKDIAYTYQVPSILLDVEGSTYSNFGEAKIEFYVNDIIPSAQNIMRVLNKIYGFTGFGFMPFFDHLEMFQPSKKDQAECMNSAVNYIGAAIQLGIMTPEECISELLKYEI